jgi:hypothetical protein
VYDIRAFFFFFLFVIFFYIHGWPNSGSTGRARPRDSFYTAEFKTGEIIKPKIKKNKERSKTSNRHESQPKGIVALTRERLAISGG